MNLFEWLQSDIRYDENSPVISFGGEQFPLLFFSLLIQRLRAQRTVTSHSLDVHNVASVRAQLGMSFLGQTGWHWLGDVSALPAKHATDMRAFLNKYTGPHDILAFVGDAASPSVTMPEKISLADYKKLVTFFAPAYAERTSLWARHLFGKDGLDLDTACLLLHYQRVLGSRMTDDARALMTEIVAPEQSLFALSQSFFAKDAPTFLSQWQIVADRYSPQFWISYWSEQVWRAYHVIALRAAGNHAEAKTVGRRLPFSFLQRDWHSVQQQELQHAHDFLYNLDWRIKHGDSDTSLEVMFHKFFGNTFLMPTL